MISSNRTFLRFPSPATVSASGGSSGLPSEKVPNTIEARLPIHIQPVVHDRVEGMESFACPSRALLEILVEHLFPACRVQAGRVCDYSVEIEQDGIVTFATDRALAHGLLHWTGLLLPVPASLFWAATARSWRTRPNLRDRIIAVSVFPQNR